jgi:hypothetical protein
VSGLLTLLKEFDDENGWCELVAGELNRELGDGRMFPAFLLCLDMQPYLDLSICGFAHSE